MLLEKTYFVEEIVSFKVGKIDFDKEHFVQLTNLFHVYLCHLKEGSYEIGNDAKGFSMGKGGFDSQATFGELVCLLHGKTKGGFGHQKFIYP